MRSISPSRCARCSISITAGSTRAAYTLYRMKPTSGRKTDRIPRLCPRLVPRADASIPGGWWSWPPTAAHGEFRLAAGFHLQHFPETFKRRFGWSRESVSAAFGFAALTVAICSPPLGHLLDRFGPRRLILPCMACSAWHSRHSVPHAPAVHLYAVFVLLGIVGNGTTQMGYSRAVSTWFDHRRGLALALVMAGVGTGAMLFPPLAQTLIAGYGWRAAYGCWERWCCCWAFP